MTKSRQAQSKMSFCIVSASYQNLPYYRLIGAVSQEKGYCCLLLTITATKPMSYSTPSSRLSVFKRRLPNRISWVICVEVPLARNLHLFRPAIAFYSLMREEQELILGGFGDFTGQPGPKTRLKTVGKTPQHRTRGYIFSRGGLNSCFLRWI